MVKVLHVGEYMAGGLATYLRTLLVDNTLVDNYFILSGYKSEKDWPLPENKVIYYTYKRSIKSLIPAMLRIRQTIRDIKPNVIYAHSTWAGVLLRFPLLFSCVNARIIYNAHGWSFLRDTDGWKKQIYALVERLLCMVTDKIINVSEYEYNAAVQYGIRKEKMCVIYSGISPVKGMIKKSVHVDKRKLNLLFVGRFDPQKGLDFLLKEFGKCERQDIHLYIIGDNIVSDGVGIEKRDTDRITFCAWVQHSEVEAYYEVCDAVVMPSRWEAFGLVAIEAMKYGKPVIASDRGALPELVQDGINGLIFEMDNAASFQSIVAKIDKASLARIGQRASKIFREKYLAHNMNMRTLELYSG